VYASRTFSLMPDLASPAQSGSKGSGLVFCHPLLLQIS
jgi:hypothetical protein